MICISSVPVHTISLRNRLRPGSHISVLITKQKKALVSPLFEWNTSALRYKKILFCFEYF